MEGLHDNCSSTEIGVGNVSNDGKMNETKSEDGIAEDGAIESERVLDTIPKTNPPPPTVVPPGASSLMSLFSHTAPVAGQIVENDHPPTPHNTILPVRQIPVRSTEAAATTMSLESATIHQTETTPVPPGASSLMELFSPPPNVIANSTSPIKQNPSIQEPSKISLQKPHVQLETKIGEKRSRNTMKKQISFSDMKYLHEQVKQKRRYDQEPSSSIDRYSDWDPEMQQNERSSLLPNRKGSARPCASSMLVPRYSNGNGYNTNKKSNNKGLLQFTSQIHSNYKSQKQEPMVSSVDDTVISYTWSHLSPIGSPDTTPTFPSKLTNLKAAPYHQQQQQPSKKYQYFHDVMKKLTTGTKTLFSQIKITKKDFVITIMGSFTFVLFHIVFSLALASSITRPHSSKPILGPLVRIVAIGPIAASPVLIPKLKGSILAVYPTVDLFLAPFLAEMAVIVDDVIWEESGGVIDDDNDDDVFLATWLVLSGIGLILAGLLNILATKVKLANLGAFLPFSVLCGFFSAVGLLVETLAFSVDTDGKKIAEVFGSGDWSLIADSLLHHIPSLIVGACMAYVGGKNPTLTPVFSVGTIVLFYLIMFLTGTTLEDATSQGWFWSKEEFKYDEVPKIIDSGFDGDMRWKPPLPFGVIAAIFSGKVNYNAVVKGLPIPVAFAAIYLLRCTLHAPALKTNASNLIKWQAEQEQKKKESSDASVLQKVLTDPSHDNSQNNENHNKIFALLSHREDSFASADGDDTEDVVDHHQKEETKREDISNNTILQWYGVALSLSGIVGGSACLPSMSAAGTLFKLGAYGQAPQYGCTLLLLFFYLTNFEPVCYIPKIAFSSLLVLSAIDLVNNWFILSYSKTMNKGEWAVVPIIVIFAFVVGMLASVGLGIALSTFIFVASIYHSGVVKFIANGLTVRSTIERGERDADLLDQNGDLIQLLVLQNYLFFGNASSCLNYITTMFEDPKGIDLMQLDFPLPPIPKYLILDMSLVTGMDTSAVDIFSNMLLLCKSHKCQIFITGLTPRLKTILACGGVKPPTKGNSRYAGLRFLPDMEAALGKAEDGLLKFVFRVEEKEIIRVRSRFMSEDNDGFSYALRQIDLQHGVKFAVGLEDLKPFTKEVQLKAGESLFHNADGSVNDDRERGLFFIESGIMKVERDSSYTTTRTTGASLRRKGLGTIYATPRISSNASLSNLKARTATIGREAALLKNAIGTSNHHRSTGKVRLGRFGPGWVVGAVEGCSELQNPGIHIAVTPCCLHHLSYRAMDELEEKNPALVLRLFKMMAHLASRRQEVTIGQLATLHSVMISPAPTKPISRVTAAAIRNAMNYQ